jgi:hypothetical protein
MCLQLFISNSSKTASLAAHAAAYATALPPNVLKYSTFIDSKASTTFCILITAAKVIPLPNGLPTVTISGTTSGTTSDPLY